MKNYIYQFAFDLNENNQKLGLKFSTEINENVEFQDFCSPIFAFKYENKKNLLFPGELNGEYNDFKIRRNRNEYYLDISKFGFKTLKKRIMFKKLNYIEDFEIFDLLEYLKYFPFNDTYIEYLGNNTKHIKKGDIFEIIVPTDLIFLDELYRKHKFCLVGYTPVFNNE